MARAAGALLALLALAATGGAAAAFFTPPATWVQCPPASFRPLLNSEFNITKYIEAPWYVQEQMPLVYQPVSQLFCVRATYLPFNSSDLSEGLRVLNEARDGSINGPWVGTADDSNPRLVATIPDLNRTAKLKVGYALAGTTTQLFPGPYWVVAVGKRNPGPSAGDGYDWAIVTGGVPRRVEGELCATGSRLEHVRRYQTNNIGLWLFTRDITDTVSVANMHAKLLELGLSDASLVTVVQNINCNYTATPPLP